jgi:hypothetical protein
LPESQMLGRQSLQAETAKSPHFYLYVDLPSFDFPVVYSEQVGLTLDLTIP